MTIEAKMKTRMEKPDQRSVMIGLLTSQGMTQSQIAKELGISRQRVGQLADRAERKGIAVVRRQIKKRICPNCGTEHTYKKKFCSKECRMMAPRKFGGPTSSIEVQIMTCDGCGTKFSRTKRLSYIRDKVREYRGKDMLKRSFCTRECYLKNGNHK